jgi:hypothetical protein
MTVRWVEQITQAAYWEDVSAGDLIPDRMAELLADSELVPWMVRLVTAAYWEWRELDAELAQLGRWGRLKRRVFGPPLVVVGDI